MEHGPKHSNANRPPMPKRQCSGCEYFIREISGGPFCRLREVAIEPTDCCPGFAFRQACRVCGCSYLDPCAEGCHWAEPGLCSACAGR